MPRQREKGPEWTTPDSGQSLHGGVREIRGGPLCPLSSSPTLRHLAPVAILPTPRGMPERRTLTLDPPSGLRQLVELLASGLQQ
jgi:hypothetical protein